YFAPIAKHRADLTHFQRSLFLFEPPRRGRVLFLSSRFGIGPIASLLRLAYYAAVAITFFTEHGATPLMTTKGEAFAGLSVALVTPFKGGDVDYETLRAQ